MIGGFSCEVCGAPAMAFAHDLIETEPVKEAGCWLRTFKQDGPTHYYCEEHCIGPKYTPFFKSLREWSDWIKSH